MAFGAPAFAAGVNDIPAFDARTGDGLNATQNTASLRGADATWQSTSSTPTGFAADLNNIPALDGRGSEGEGVNLDQILQSPDSHVTWQETSAPAEGVDLPANTIKVDLSNNVSKYYQYTYSKPVNYTGVTENIYNTLDSDNATNKLFYGISRGAIYNSQDKSDVNITSDFMNNSARYSGGAIENRGSLANIKGDFINNSNLATDDVSMYSDGAGAIKNYGTNANITGNFISNSTVADYGGYYGRGGAIRNSGTVGDITANFINNRAMAIDGCDGGAEGGAISNIETIGNITGDFINNSISATYGSVYGGAIHNSGRIGDITGNFVNNSSKAGISEYNIKSAEGGAIANYGTIGNITGDFINNSVTATSLGYATGGAIFNSGYRGSIGKKDADGNVVGGIINSNFIGNYAKSETGTVQGGAIWTGKDLNIIADNGKSEFTGNYVQIGDGEKDYQAIYLGSSGRTQTPPEVLDLPYSGMIYTSTTPTLNIIAKNNGTILFNDKIVTSGDVGYNFNYSHEDETIGEFSGVVNTCNILDKDNNVTDSVRYYYERIGDGDDGEPIEICNILDKDNNITDSIRFSYDYTDERIGDGDDGEPIEICNILDKDNNITDSTRLYATQYKDTDLTIYYILDDDNNVVKTIVSPIHEFIVAKDAKPMTLTPAEVQITGDSTGRVILNNNIESFKDGERAAVNVSLSNTQLHLGVRDNVLDGNNLTLNSGTFNMVNNQVGVSALNSLTVAGDTNFIADVDLANSEMDRFTATSYGEHHGNLNVIGMNLLSDAPEGNDKTEIFFAETGLKDNVTNGTGELPDKNQTVAYTPIYKYNVSYDNRNDGGYFVFNRGALINGGGGNSGNPSDNFNPAVLSVPTANVAATQATVNETFKYVFEHADAFTQLPSHVRHASLNANKYAISTDFNNNLGELYKNNSAGWFRPYVTFEKMDLKHGPKVDAITYGSLAGFDTDFHEHKRGWHSVGTGYIGYNGNQLHYQGVDTTMNGGLLGYTHTMYKNNFWTALTLSAGASVGESRTMYGKEDFTSLMAGVGSKTGYNFEFKEGKYILQPIMFMSYTFANTFDYTNAAGVKIKPSPAHSIQLNPSVRFIANTKNGWQPYASVGMVWNVMNENKVTADTVRLPESSMKPYVEYGVGLQRNWKDRFTAFGQAMIRNGGRNGIALTGGFRWALGKGVNETPKEKVQAPVQKVTLSEGVRVQTQSSTKTVLKQLSPAQKTALGKRQNTTRTTSAAVFRAL